MAIHSMRPLGVIVHGVEQCLMVTRPGDRFDPGNVLRPVFPGAQVLDSQCVLAESRGIQTIGQLVIIAR